MLNPLKWQRGHLVALFASIPVGAIAGIALGYALSEWKWGGLNHWLSGRSGDALAWAALGALVLSAAMYGALIIVRPRRTGRATRASLKPGTKPHDRRSLTASIAKVRTVTGEPVAAVRSA